MDLFVTPRYLEPSSAGEIEALEALVGGLPEGYRAFVAGYGGAVVDGTVRVYPPRQIVGELAALRQRWDENWFWESDDSSAPARATASHLVILADTVSGDEIVYLQESPARLWLLPRDADVVEPIGSTFDQAVEHVCNWILSVPRPHAPYSISALDEPRVMFTGTFPSGGDALAALVRTAASIAFSSSIDEGDGPFETMGLADQSGLVWVFRSHGSQNEPPEHWASISGAYEQPGTDAARVVERLRATGLTEQTSSGRSPEQRTDDDED